MPARISAETARKFDQLLAQGFPVSKACDAAGVSKDWGDARSRGARRRDRSNLSFLCDMPPRAVPPLVVEVRAIGGEDIVLDFSYGERITVVIKGGGSGDA